MKDWWEAEHRLSVDELLLGIPALQGNHRSSQFRPGHFDIYSGPMYSGKSGDLIRQLEQAEFFKAKYIAFKPSADDRDGLQEFIVSRYGGQIPCRSIRSDRPEELLSYVTEATQIIGIDEVQFFSTDIVDVVKALRLKNRHVVVSLLNSDFRGVPFPTAALLLASAPNRITSLAAGCTYGECTEDALYSQRLLNGQPVPYDDNVKSIQGKREGEEYVARCLRHHQVLPAKSSTS